MNTNWKALAFVVALLAIFLFLNWNSEISRYNDLIRNCEFQKANSASPNRAGWAAARDARYSTYQRTSQQTDFDAYLKYQAIVAKLDTVIERPCSDRYQKPGVFG